MKRALKISVLLLLKMLGGFAFCRWLNRRKLRILCYHGLALGDEDGLDDLLFMRPGTFRRRLELVRKHGMNVLPLAEAVRALSENRNPDHALVITFDDGWYSTETAARILKEFGFPSMVYLATEYLGQERSIFNVLIRYLYWKGGAN